MSLVTIVSCFYILESSKHSLENYVFWMINFFKIKTPKIIYTNNYTYNRLFKKIVCEDIQFVIYEIEDFVITNKLTDTQWATQLSSDPENDIHNIDLYKIWNEKSEMLRKAINHNKFNSSYYYWCDAGCFRDNSTIENYIDWPNEKAVKKNDFILLNIEKFETHDISINMRGLPPTFIDKNRIGGGIFGGTKESCLKWHNLYYKMVDKFIINNRFIGKDQSIMANIYIEQLLTKKTDFISLIKIPSFYKKNIWFYLQDYLL